MNKMIKLPLFLGVCGAACAGILAGVYALTNPIVQRNAEKIANAAIYATFSTYGDENSLTVETKELTDDLIAVGVLSKKKVTGSGLTDGMVYNVTTTKKGYAGTISFQLAFAEGKFLSYTNIANSETKELIGRLSNGEILSGTAAAGYSFAVVSGETFTSNALKSAIDVIVADYTK